MNLTALRAKWFHIVVAPMEQRSQGLTDTCGRMEPLELAAYLTPSAYCTERPCINWSANATLNIADKHSSSHCEEKFQHITNFAKLRMILRRSALLCATSVPVVASGPERVVKSCRLGLRVSLRVSLSKLRSGNTLFARLGSIVRSFVCPNCDISH